MEKHNYFHHESIHKNVIWSQYGVVKPWNIYEKARSSKNFIHRLKRWSVLDGHSGCVNTLSWNTNGYLLLTGSDDYLLNIYNVYAEKLLHSVESGHRANIFSAKFLPCTSDMKIVSCSGDGMLHFNELGTHYGQNHFNCHSGTAYEVLVTPGDPNTFLSCGEDGTVRMFDLRTKTKCYCQECSEDILIDCRHAVTSISVNPLAPYELAAGCKDSNVRVFDRRTLGTSCDTRTVNKNRGWMPGLFSRFKPEKLKKDMSCRVTSLQYSDDGKDLLVSYCTDYVYAFTVKDGAGKTMELKKNRRESSEGNGACNGYISEGSEELPPVKRLRLRGDWSDTGPQARPETEDESTPENTLMQRMSELFTRWLEDAMYPSERRTSNGSSQSDESRTAARSSVGEAADETGQDTSTNVVTNQHATNTDQSVTNNLECSLDSVDENWMLHDAEYDNAFENANDAAQKVDVTNNSSQNRTTESAHDSDAVQSSVEENIVVETDVNSIDISSERLASASANIDSNAMIDGKGDESVNDSSSKQDGLSETTPLLSNVKAGASNSSSVNQHFTLEQGDNHLEDVSHDVNNTAIPSVDHIPFVSEEHGISSSNNAVNYEREIERQRLDRDVAAMRIQGFLKTYRNRRGIKECNYAIPDRIYMPNTSMVYKGHRNARTMIKEANFWGDHFVLSGSDCGRIFIWDRHTGELVMSLQGDRHVVNCVQPHPYDPILATSGIDRDIKIWAPLSEQEADLSELTEIVKRNERMLEESRDTITVPASFVLRMLASFGSIRNRRDGHRQMEMDVGTEDMDDDNEFS